MRAVAISRFGPIDSSGRLLPLEVATNPLQRAVKAMAAVRDRRANGRLVLAVHDP
jgi:NADPH:quinone reductase-like Zn-dependent oxidoreductase